MRIALAGKAGSITHWLEDAAGAWRDDGHEILRLFTRRPWLAAPLEEALAAPIARRLRARLTRFRPDVIVAIGAYHVPLPLLEAISSMPGRPPLVGWVGDAFAPEEARRASLYDLVGYTDSALLARHRQWGFTGEGLYLPHAVDPRATAPETTFDARAARMVFVATATPGRRRIVEALEQPIGLYGPGWRGMKGHEVHGRIAATRVGPILRGARAALNIRNELNVISGLNQRNFEPCLAGAALLTDAQPDLELCFDPGAEVLVWRDAAELNSLHARVLAEPDFAGRVAAAGRARVLAHHTFDHRLAALMAALGFRDTARRPCG